MLFNATRRWLLLIPIFIFIFAAWNYHAETQYWIVHQFSRPHKQDPIHTIPEPDEALQPSDDENIRIPELEGSRQKEPESSPAQPSELSIPVDQAHESETTPHETQSEDSSQAKTNPHTSVHTNQDQEQSSKGKQHHKESTHDVLYGISTPGKTYFNITMAKQVSFNPNILPHPTEPGTFLVVAQQDGRSIVDGRYYSEIFCSAKFTSTGNLECIRGPAALFIGLSQTTHCKGNLGIFAANMGPHDGRVFYGPRGRPYIIYGSQSSHTCMSLWIHDLQVVMGSMVSWGFDNYKFKNATEITRPEPWAPLEKNWFLFWHNDEMYAHYDFYPKRTFAKLALDGSAGPDLAPKSNKHDEQCLKKLPQIGHEESLHQATNSLSITLCDRSDSACIPNDDNTFIFILVQHKAESAFHANYEPYLVAFRRRSPFELYGISKKPFWFNGRTGDQDYAQTVETGTQQMMYTTSMNWKKAGQNYHGFQDDALIIGFGIENAFSAGIDIVAGDLFRNMDLCSSVR